MYAKAFDDPEFNVSELSLANYITRAERGDCAYTLLPVHVSRSFKHSAIYVRTDRGIVTPQDLRGRKIGLTEYNHTAYTWVRAFLKDDYDVDGRDICWVSGRREATSRALMHDLKPPAGVSIRSTAPETNLSDMLEAGELDALINPTEPSCFKRHAPNIARMFPNYGEVENEYYRRTRIYPILHLMAMRTGLAEKHPDLPVAIYQAFVAAKILGMAAVREASTVSGFDPEQAAYVRRMTALLGEDFHPYGLGEPECRTLEYFARHHFSQGLASRKFATEDLFASLDPAQFG
jgi:4,5-dihydroxyphthalate decarboxylase